jgi:hypothetical protein
MGYKQQLDKGLRFAFKQAKDLVETATIYRTETSDFNFGTGTASNTTTTLTVDVLATDVTKGNTRGTIRKQVLMMTADVGDLKAYDMMTLGGVDFKFGPIMKNDGYMSMLEVLKENGDG